MCTKDESEWSFDHWMGLAVVCLGVFFVLSTLVNTLRVDKVTNRNTEETETAEQQDEIDRLWSSETRP